MLDPGYGGGPGITRTATTTEDAPATGTAAEPMVSPLRGELESHDVPLKALTVLAPQNDPFRVDTPAGHRDGAWLAMQVEALGLGDRTIHLRGLHYAVLGRTRPDGKPYHNTEEAWMWLSGKAAKAARWLGYIPFDAITDERNAAPVLIVHETGEPEPFLDLGGIPAVLPHEVDDPAVWLDGVHPRQVHRLVIYGEKSSLAPVLGPLCEEFEADLYLPTGEISDTLMHQMAADAAEDGRPLVVLTFADSDPSGWQMPISIARKLQGFRAALFPGLEFEVLRVGLLPEHVEAYGLPSTPLKATERRGDAWTEAMRVEQTEIDALASLRPGVLEALAREALDGFYDHSLRRRTREAENEWTEEAQARLVDLVGPDALAEFRAEAQEKLATLTEEVEAINSALSIDAQDLNLPLFKVPEAIIPGAHGEPLIDSRWSFPDQCQALIESKQYQGGASR